MLDYHETITFKQATEIYELTKEFCHKYLHTIRDSRLIDQMISSGRSVKQNLAEGPTRNGIKDYIEIQLRLITLRVILCLTIICYHHI